MNQRHLAVGSLLSLALLAPVLAGSALAADAPKPARALIDAGLERAKAEGKPVLVVFGASW